MKSNRKKSKANKKSEPKPAAATTSGLIWAAHWLPPLLIALVTVAAFFPALHNEFVDWDDYYTLVENPSYRGLGWTQLRWMLTTFKMGHYQPLSWMTFGLDYLLWGLNPFGYHLSNLFLHATNAALFYFVTLRLLSLALSSPSMSKDPGLRVAAGFATLIFAIHPLRVESVAWVTERRDVLSGFFFLWTILCYLRAAAVGETDHNRWRWMVGAVVVYSLSLLAKASGVTLPIVLLVLDVYPSRRLGVGRGGWFGPAARRIWWEKIPFLILALLAGVIAPIAQNQFGALRPFDRYGIVPRVAQAFFGLAFYLQKTVVPLALSPLYEIPIHLNPWDWPFLVSAVVVLAISTVLIVARRRWQGGLASWICYIVILVPVLGLTQSGNQIAADRYSYLSCLGWAILSGGGLFYIWQAWRNGRMGRRTFMPTMGVATVVVVSLGVLTWRQTHVWYDSETLWRHVLAVTEKSYFKSPTAHYNLANVLVKKGKLEEGISHLREALQIDPTYASAHFNLGNALVSRGELGEAIEQYRQALQIDPAHIGARTNLGNALVAQGRLEEAMEQYQEALKIRLDVVQPHINLAHLLVRKGDLDEAIKHYRQALALSPGDSEIHLYLGNILVSQGRLNEAIPHFQEALKIKPDYEAAYVSLGKAMGLRRKGDETIQQYKEALRAMKARRAAPSPSK